MKYTTFHKPPVCAFLNYDEKIAKLLLCLKSNINTDPHFLCESDVEEIVSSTPADRQRLLVRIPTPTKQTPPLPHVQCPAGHLTHELLACDAHSYCWEQFDVTASDGRKTSTSSSSCLAPLTSVPPSFSCASGPERVPYSMVCDHSRDCLDSSDEDFCVFPLCHGSGQFECNNKQVRSLAFLYL